jgi:hypothetical protein
MKLGLKEQHIGYEIMTAVAMKCMIFWERSNCRLLLGDLP